MSDGNTTAPTMTTAETMGDAVREHAANTPDALAFTFGDETQTFAELDAGSNRTAHGLVSMGVGRGDRIAYLGKNHHLYFEILIAASKIGAVMTPVNWRLAAPEVAHILGDSCAPLVVIGDGFADMARTAIASLEAAGDKPVPKHIMGIDAPDSGEDVIDYRTWRDGFSDEDPAHPITSADDALQLYTSGTTGLPKGAVLTHSALLASRDADGNDYPLREWQEPVPGEVTMLAMPIFHIAGTGTGLQTLAGGTNALVMPEYDPGAALQLIDKYQISKLFLVPAAIQMMLDHPSVDDVDFSDLKYINYGAAPIPLALMKAAMEKFGCGFVQMYGMTETTGTVVALDPEDHVPEGSKRMRSVGRPMAGVEIKVIDEEGKPLGVNEVGEIATRSARNMRGYWNKPDATHETIDGDGWLRTGDAGYLDEDGYLYIHDRVKDMIISGGENVYPAEVENAVYSHPQIADVAVIGIPSDKWGEEVKACVVLKPGAELSAEDVIAHARSQIAGYKCPKSIDFIPVLPRNPSGKILRRELRAPYWEGRDRAVN